MNKTTTLTRLFGFDPQTMNVRTEIIAGITTFLTMAYILAVNPNIMGDIGMDKGAIFTTTAIISMFSTLIMALYARLPFALAPGMGLNAFFAYTVCTKMGYDWSFALTAVLIEGVAFIILTETNLRDAIVNAIPASIRNAIGPGIGLYIAFIGLKNGGVIASSPATFVTLGTITSGPGLLSIIGLVLTGTEIKSIRLGKASLVDTFAIVEHGEVWVKNMYVAEYFFGTYNNHAPRRDRKLLLNRKEIRRLQTAAKDRGFTLVPTRLFINERGLAKLVLAIARGKKEYDKRQSIRERDDRREMDRMFKK